jgi:hypothetical protein
MSNELAFRYNTHTRFSLSSLTSNLDVRTILGTQTDNGRLFPRKHTHAFILLQKRYGYMFEERFKLFNTRKLSSLFK